MPVYEYEHEGAPCRLGRVFEWRQSLEEKALSLCPGCGGRVRKLISCPNLSTPKTNSELRDLGFTKLVRRDDGVYENVTARDRDNRYMIRGKPETIPDVKRTISD
ncbi:MAG: zinc ribbon domain-containing protein [Desulfobacteraceae bacterium]|nr:MAG: zinc ribbon domain-containing protein [Desulfobacteraceae bacterium]